MKRLFFSTYMRTALVAVAVGVLSACNGQRYEMPAPPIAMQPQGDQFTASVQSVTSTTPDNTEPASLDAITITSVDDKEPEAVI